MLSILPALALLCGITLAAPNSLKTDAAVLPDQQTKGSFTVRQVPSHKSKFNGALSVYRTYLKYGVPPPEELRLAVARMAAPGKRTAGSVIADPIDTFDSAYVSPVQIGTPPQTLNLDFDTGSSDMWVFASQTPAAQITGQTIFKPESSSTAKELAGATWSILYGDGSRSRGIVYNDIVSIGGVSLTQAVQVATNVSKEFTSLGDIDGLLGLGFDTLNTVRPDKQKTFISNALGQLDKPLFAVDLKYGAAGSYDFGYINNTKYTGEITYSTVNTAVGYWLFTSPGYGVGSNAFTARPIEGIADTGTTLIYLPTNVTSDYYAQVTNATYSSDEGGWVFPCEVTLPNLTLGIEGARIVIPGKFLSFSLNVFTCFGGIQSSAGIGINIFGDVALKAAYVVFDRSTTPPRIGWASKPL